MKKVILGSLLAVFIMTACEQSNEDLIKPSLEDKTLHSSVFSRKEIDGLVCEKLGCERLTFEEEAEFLMEHINNSVWGGDNKSGTPMGRVSTEWTSIGCHAGIYYGDIDQWVFKSTYGNSDAFVYSSKSDFVDSPQTVGSSASIYGGHHPYYYEMLAIDTFDPQYYDCDGSDIRGLATASWSPNASVKANVYADSECDD